MSGWERIDGGAQVGWGLVIEGFVCHVEDFEMDSLGDGEPVELMEDFALLSGSLFTEHRSCWSITASICLFVSLCNVGELKPSFQNTEVKQYINKLTNQGSGS